MKKKLLPLSLVACFSAIALSSCGNSWLQDAEGKVVLTIDGTEYTTDELFNQFKTSNTTGIGAYYDAISEVLIRNATRTYAQSTELEQKVKSLIEDDKETARDNAEANGTKYKTELKAILDEKGVEDLDELEELYTYQELQNHLEDVYYDIHTDEMLSDYLDTMLPYHIRHILIKVSASDGTLYNGTITQNEAMNLASVVRRLANLQREKDGTFTEKVKKETFGDVALDASEDDSGKEYGNLSVMTTKTSFVNEFKLGIYAYESLVAKKDVENRGKYFTDNVIDADSVMDLKKNAYAIPEEDQTAWLNHGIKEIPFDASQKLEDYADKTTTDGNKVVNDGDALYYPRNIYFNHYFNDHGISVITNDTEIGNFKKVDGFEKPVLCADGNPDKVILITRAGSGYQGVHFMVVEKSAINSTHDQLATYYDKRTPAQLTKDGDADLIGSTYVTAFKSTDTSVYNSRSTAIENEVKSYNTMLDTDLFIYYLGISVGKDGQLEKPVDEDGKELPIVKIADQDLQKQLLDYIETNRAKAKSDDILSYEESWDAYIKLLETQDWFSDYRVKLVCAEKFKDGFVEGDGCYVEK